MGNLSMGQMLMYGGIIMVAVGIAGFFLCTVIFNKLKKKTLERISKDV